MPHSPPYPCNYPRCTELIPKGQRLCAKHKKKYEADDRLVRKEINISWYATPRWRNYRKQYLMQHPLCVKCKEKGRYTSANVVDHIVPHRGNEGRFWDENNHQSLCTSCHNSKSQSERIDR